MQPNEKYDWSRLNHLQLGKYAEYFVKMECVLYGFDVYTAEVDDKGIDFVLRVGDNSYYDVQVKSTRGDYIFFPKSKFKKNMLAAVALFRPHQAPNLFLMRATEWETPNALFVSHDYENSTKSKPEWGLNLSQKNMPLLAEFAFDKTAEKILREAEHVDASAT